MGGSSALSFAGAYGENSGTSESVEVGSTAGVEAVLQPGQAVVFELGITSGRIEAQVTYRRQLTDGAFVHYGQKQGGHYFWNVPLAQLYDPHALRQHQREALRVDFYSHARTTQRDPFPEELVQLSRKGWINGRSRPLCSGVQTHGAQPENSSGPCLLNPWVFGETRIFQTLSSWPRMSGVKPVSSMVP